MNTGPSKEQIENFFKTSRKYFDELARQYYEKDREFYNKNFAQYYKSPLNAGSKGIPNVKARLLLMAFLILIAGLIFGLTYFLLDYSKREEAKAEKELIEINRNQELIQRQLIDSILNLDSTVRSLSEPLIIRERNNGAKSIRRKSANE